MATRYSTTRVLNNASDYYSPLRKKRGDKRIRQYETPQLYHPKVSEKKKIPATTHVWKSTDRLSNLAHQHYGDVRYWWVIAWYNGYPTEAHLFAGASLIIPLSLDSALGALRV